MTRISSSHDNRNDNSNARFSMRIRRAIPRFGSHSRARARACVFLREKIFFQSAIQTLDFVRSAREILATKCANNKLENFHGTERGRGGGNLCSEISCLSLVSLFLHRAANAVRLFFFPARGRTTPLNKLPRFNTRCRVPKGERERGREEKRGYVQRRVRGLGAFHRCFIGN